METRELLTIKELAERLKLKPRTVRLWWRKGLLPGISIGHRFVRFDIAEVIEALKKQGAE